MSFKLRSLFAAVAVAMSGTAQNMQAAIMGPPKPLKAAEASIGSSGGSIRRPASRRQARANKLKAARYAKRSTKRARGHASRHA